MKLISNEEECGYNDIYVDSDYGYYRFRKAFLGKRVSFVLYYLIYLLYICWRKIL